MKRLLMSALIIAVGLFGTWSVAADSPNPPLPEPQLDKKPADEPQPIQPEQAEAEATQPDANTPEAKLEVEGFETLVPELQNRQNSSCTYTCVHPLMCPNIPDLPRASCIGGCCVW